MRALAGMSELLMFLPYMLVMNIVIGVCGIGIVTQSWGLVVRLGANRRTDVRWMAGANVAVGIGFIASTAYMLIACNVDDYRQAALVGSDDVRPPASTGTICGEISPLTSGGLWGLLYIGACMLMVLYSAMGRSMVQDK